MLLWRELSQFLLFGSKISMEITSFYNIIFFQLKYIPEETIELIKTAS